MSLVVVAGLGGAALATTGGSDDDGPPTTIPGPSPEEQAAATLECAIEPNPPGTSAVWGLVSARGEITNRSADATRTYGVDIDFLDVAGNVVATRGAPAIVVEPGRTEEFSTGPPWPVMAPVSTCRVAEVQ